MPWISIWGTTAASNTLPLLYGQYVQTTTATGSGLLWLNQPQTWTAGSNNVWVAVQPAWWTQIARQQQEAAGGMQSVLPDSAAATARLLFARQRAQERAIRRREAEMARHSEDVQQRARDLLLRNLSAAQRESFLEHKFFVVEGRSKTRYRIEDRGHMVANIAVIERGETIARRLCGHCEHKIPMGDQLLAQKLMLEGAEDEFLKLANRHAA